MASLSRVFATVGALERNAVTASRTLAAELLRPTAERDDLGDPAAALVETLEAARDVMGRHRLPLREADTPDGRRLRDIRTRLQQWETVAEAVTDCLAGHQWPLLPDAAPRLDLGGAQGALMSEAFTRAHRAFNPEPQDEAALAGGAYADIPLEASAFIAAVHLAYRIRLALKTPRPWRFLDVGCGGGMKVTLAAEFFDEAEGIEIDPGYAAAAARTFAAMRAHRCRVEEADALSWGRYSDFDVIYFYRPMHDAEDLLALERRIVGESGEDVILIAPYRGFALRAARHGCVHLGGHVFMKEGNGAVLSDLVEEARRMGPHVFGADQDPPQGLGWLRPLWLACAANGVCPA